MSHTALGKFRILDISNGIAGAYCTKLFADYGADVIKIEPPDTGDLTRQMAPFFKDDPHIEKSLVFFYLNCNKRSVTIDLQTTEGRELFLGLIAQSDGLICDNSHGYLEKLDLGYETLQKINQQLVLTTITPFGDSGPYRNYLGSDLLYYAMSGMMYTSGAYSREPLKHGHPQSYYMGGITAAYSTLAALFSRNFTGVGQHVDLSVQECVAAHHYDSAARYSYTGTVERRSPKVESGSTKGTRFEGIVKAKDGYVSPTMQKGRPTAPYSEYAALLGLSDTDDPRFATRQTISEHRQELDEIVLPELENWGKMDYYNTFMNEGFVAGVVQTPEDLLDCPQLDERAFYSEIEHPIMGLIKIPGEIFRLPNCPWRLRTPAPMLGQHTEEILSELLEYPKPKITKLLQSEAT
jgi:crotonobetainyl-CoA:carnitine CoA-transferase CaiB-like acyl-CoA transferase